MGFVVLEGMIERRIYCFESGIIRADDLITMNELFEQGVAAAQAGRREEARALLMQVVEADERNEHAWLWLASVVDDPNDLRVCLENVLHLNPQHAQARHVLDQLVAQAQPTAAPPASLPEPQTPAAAPATTSHPQSLATNEQRPCVYCGATTADDQQRCSVCGKSLMLRLDPSPNKSSALRMLTILSGIGSVLTILSGIVMFVAGFVLAQGSEMLKEQPKQFQRELQRSLPPGTRLPAGFDAMQFLDVISFFVYGVALTFLVSGVFYMFVTRALGRQRRWAYVIAIILSVINGAWYAFALSLEAMFGSFTLNTLFSAAIQTLMIVLTVLSYRDFWGPKVRFQPEVGYGDDVVHYNNGVAYKKRGMWYMAAREWEAAARKAPNNIEYLHALGLIYAQIKHFDHARLTLDRAVAIAPDNAQLRESRTLIDRYGR